MGKLLFKIKYEPMRHYANRMIQPLNSIDYTKPDFNSNKNVKTIDNYLKQEEKIQNLMNLYHSLVKKDSKDLAKMIDEMERTDENRSKKWQSISRFIPGCNINEVLYGPPQNRPGITIQENVNPGGGGGGTGR